MRRLIQLGVLLIALAGFVTADVVSRSGNSVNFRGISFQFDSSLANEVKPETIPASLDGKPSDIWPEHPSFTLVGYRRTRVMQETDPQIRVFRLDKFREAVKIASDENAKSVISPPKPPSWTIDFDEEVRVLKELLRVKPSHATINSFLAKVRGRQSCSAAMPFLPMWEACQALVARPTYVNFQNGKGVFFLTQWDTETSLITNAGLEYAFQGITNDGQYWIYAEFAVSAPFLPKGDDAAVVEWETKNYLLPHNSKKYQTYVRPVVFKLNQLTAGDFQPNLRLLEQLIASMEVKPE